MVNKRSRSGLKAQQAHSPGHRPGYVYRREVRPASYGFMQAVFVNDSLCYFIFPLLAVIPQDSLVLVVWFIVHIILYKRIDEVYKLVLDIVQDHSRRFSFGLHPVVVGTVDSVPQDCALGRLGYNGP